jgi:hypothetical protein
MKVLSLLQPWASLVVTANPNRAVTSSTGPKPIGLKEWETRCWRPKDPTLIEVLKTQGFLIHASLGWKPQQQLLMNDWPFSEYAEQLHLSFGCIIGHVKLDRIWTTDRWIQENAKSETETTQVEYEFGDYSSGRFAWCLCEPQLFKQPIPAKGALNLWDYKLPVPELKK